MIMEDVIGSASGSAHNLVKYRSPVIPQSRTMAGSMTKSLRTTSRDGNVPVAGIRPITHGTVEEKLFTATAAAKIWTSRLSMHLERSTKERLFAQIDVLHDSDEWSDGDVPVALESYKTLLQAIIYHKINSKPSIALSPQGNILARWRYGSDHLTVEFLPANKIRWFVQVNVGEEPEKVSGIGPLERLRAVLQPYKADRWFDGS